MQNIDFTKISSPLSARIEIAQKSYLYFGGTAYLGIPQNEAFIKLYIDGIKRFGLNNGTSRNNNVQLGIYNEVEDFAAKKYQAPSALITSSGYLAAQLVIKQLLKKNVRYAPATHPALWLNKMPNVTGSFKKWSEEIVFEINQSEEKDWIIISNSINNLYPECYDFSFIKQIDSAKNILLLVDDSHGIGVINNGSSVYSSIPKLPNIEVLVIASMAKALGVDAGLILGSKQQISTLKETNEFLGASPPSAAGLFAFMNATEIYESAFAHLKELSLALGNALNNDPSWSFISDFPVFLSADPSLNQELLKKQILISAFPYPDKDGDLINRIVLSSWHSLKDIQELILSLKNK